MDLANPAAREGSVEKQHRILRILPAVKSCFRPLSSRLRTDRVQALDGINVSLRSPFVISIIQTLISAFAFSHRRIDQQTLKAELA
jgi:hypothetical protein